MHFMSRRVPEEVLGSAQGVFFALSGTIMAIATTVSGQLYEAHGDGAYWVMAAMALGAGISLIYGLGSAPERR